jgi:hypothetical protein
MAAARRPERDTARAMSQENVEVVRFHTSASLPLICPPSWTAVTTCSSSAWSTSLDSIWKSRNPPTPEGVATTIGRRAIEFARGIVPHFRDEAPSESNRRRGNSDADFTRRRAPRRASSRRGAPASRVVLVGGFAKPNPENAEIVTRGWTPPRIAWHAVVPNPEYLCRARNARCDLPWLSRGGGGTHESHRSEHRPA